MQAGFEPGIFRSRGGRLNHLANETVREECVHQTGLTVNESMCLGKNEKMVAEGKKGVYVWGKFMGMKRLRLERERESESLCVCVCVCICVCLHACVCVSACACVPT